MREKVCQEMREGVTYRDNAAVEKITFFCRTLPDFKGARKAKGGGVRRAGA